MGAAATLADDEAGVALARGQFVACLLTFVQPLTGASASVEGAGSRWTGQQLRDLQAQALRLLARLAPLCVDELTAQGAGRRPWPWPARIPPRMTTRGRRRSIFS